MKLIYIILFCFFYHNLIAEDFRSRSSVNLIYQGDFMKKGNWRGNGFPKTMDSIVLKNGGHFVLQDDFTKSSRSQLFWLTVGENSEDVLELTKFDFKEGAYLLLASNFSLGAASRDLDRLDPMTPIEFNMSGGELICNQFFVGGRSSDTWLAHNPAKFNMTGGIIRAHRFLCGHGEQPVEVNLTGGKIFLGSIEELVSYDHDEYYEYGDKHMHISAGEIAQTTINWSILSRDYTQIIIEQGATGTSNLRNAIVNFNLSLLRRPIELPLIDNRGTGKILDADVTFNFYQLASDLKAEVTKGDGNDWILSITKK